jgi:hypothetical protein
LTHTASTNDRGFVAENRPIAKALFYLFAYWLFFLLIAAVIGFLAGSLGSEILIVLRLLDKRWFYLVPVGFATTFVLATLPDLLRKTGRFWSAYRGSVGFKKD